MAEVALSANEFKALSSKTRVDIIKLLAVRNHNLSELAAKLGMSSPTIKQHLGTLGKAGLVEQIESRHKWKYYTLSNKSKALVGKAEASILIVLALASLAMVGLLYEFISKFWVLFVGAAKPIASGAPEMSQGLTGASAPALEAGKNEVVKGIAEKAAAQAVSAAGFADVVLYIAVIIALGLLIAFCIMKMRKMPKASYFVDKRNK